MNDISMDTEPKLCFVGYRKFWFISTRFEMLEERSYVLNLENMFTFCTLQTLSGYFFSVNGKLHILSTFHTNLTLVSKLHLKSIWKLFLATIKFYVLYNSAQKQNTWFNYVLYCCLKNLQLIANSLIKFLIKCLVIYWNVLSRYNFKGFKDTKGYK